MRCVFLSLLLLVSTAWAQASLNDPEAVDTVIDGFVRDGYLALDLVEDGVIGLDDPVTDRKLPLNQDHSLVSTSGKLMTGGATEQVAIYREPDRADASEFMLISNIIVNGSKYTAFFNFPYVGRATGGYGRQHCC